MEGAILEKKEERKEEVMQFQNSGICVLGLISQES